MLGTSAGRLERVARPPGAHQALQQALRVDHVASQPRDGTGQPGVVFGRVLDVPGVLGVDGPGELDDVAGPVHHSAREGDRGQAAHLQLVREVVAQLGLQRWFGRGQVDGRLDRRGGGRCRGVPGRPGLAEDLLGLLAYRLAGVGEQARLGWRRTRVLPTGQLRVVGLRRAVVGGDLLVVGGLGRRGGLLALRVAVDGLLGPVLGRLHRPRVRLQGP